MLSVETLKAMKPISADSHIVEPPDIFIDRIGRALRVIPQAASRYLLDLSTNPVTPAPQ